jgi:serpin B
MNHRIALIPALISLLAVACTSDETSDQPPAGEHTTVRSALARDTTPDVPADALTLIASGNQDLTFELYQQTAQPGTNYFASPLSIQQAFALVYAGARGETATEMASVLHFDGEPDTFHAAMNAFDLALTSRNLPEETNGDSVLAPVQLRVANAFWGQDGYPWLEPYLDILAVNYGAGIEALDFQADPEAARQTINAWVEGRTEDRIRDLLPEGSLGADTAAVLTNAIYFKAPWQTQFEEYATVDGPFTLVDGTTVSAPLMHQMLFGRYAVSDGWDAVELPFRGNKLSMLIVVPTLGSFDEIDATLDGEWLRGLIESLEQGTVEVTLPRFTFESEFTLSDALMALGMTTAFGGSCDLSGMLEGGGLFIDEAYHKAFIAVDESGAEAAAATAVVVGETSVPVVEASIVADRPFYFAIRDRETQLVIFWGRVMNPTI